MKLAPLLRSAALVTAVALIPATTATFAQVDGRAGPEFARLFEVYQRIQASYVEPVDKDKLVRGAIDGMLASLDPHSAYLDGGDLQRLETMIDGNYSGLGLSVIMEDGAVKVINPFRGSPADQMGIKAGDFITHLDGQLRAADHPHARLLTVGVGQLKGRRAVFRVGTEQHFGPGAACCHSEQFGADVHDPAQERLFVFELRLPAAHAVESLPGEPPRGSFNKPQVLAQAPELTVGARIHACSGY